MKWPPFLTQTKLTGIFLDGVTAEFVVRTDSQVDFKKSKWGAGVPPHHLPCRQTVQPQSLFLKGLCLGQQRGMPIPHFPRLSRIIDGSVFPPFSVSGSRILSRGWFYFKPTCTQRAHPPRDTALYTLQPSGQSSVSHGADKLPAKVFLFF